MNYLHPLSAFIDQAKYKFFLVCPPEAGFFFHPSLHLFQFETFSCFLTQAGKIVWKFSYGHIGTTQKNSSFV